MPWAPLWRAGKIAWKFFGGAKDFCPNFLKIAEKFLCDFCLQILFYKDREDFFWYDLQKKAFMCFSASIGPDFLKSNNVGRLFCPVFGEFAQIFRDFTRIFSKSKLLWLSLHPSFIHHSQALWQINGIVTKHDIVTEQERYYASSTRHHPSHAIRKSKSVHTVVFQARRYYSQNLVRTTLSPRLWESDCDANNCCWGHVKIYKLLKLLQTAAHSDFTKLLRWPLVSDK